MAKHIHVDQPGHTVDVKNTKILAVEPRWYERGVKEAVHICTAKPSLNKDGGRFQLPAVWKNMLQRRVGGPRSSDLKDC